MAASDQGEPISNRRDLAGGQVMEQRDVSTEMIAGRREVGGAEPIEPCLGFGVQRQGEDQRRLVRRWLELTRTVLPDMARTQGWPIRFDHCFMRVILDNVFDGVWYDFVERPAVRHLQPAALTRAVALAEAVAREPRLLPELNRRSVRWRRLARQPRTCV